MAEVRNTGSNRKSRRSRLVYRFVPLFKTESDVEPLESGPQHYVEGELGDFLIVSVPPMTTQAAAQELRVALVKTVKRPVLVITHNTEFMVGERLRPREAARILKQAEGSNVAKASGD